MNAALFGNTQNQFVTAAYVHLNSETGEFRYSAAGHPPMLLLRKGKITEIAENGLMLAAFDSAQYSNSSHQLEAGDRILLYTDGIVEGESLGRISWTRGFVRVAAADSRIATG
jgi:sigma-B regulation protein RsbU (phosphoserine phosphatase)